MSIASEIAAPVIRNAYRIFKLVIDNFRGIKCSSIDAAGNHVIIEGPNGSGKSSHVDALFWIMTGKCPGGNPVRHGASEASGTLILDNGNPDEQLVLERRIDSRDDVEFGLFRGGEQVKSGSQGAVNLLLSKYMLDPMAFLALRPQDQKDLVLQLSKEPPPTAEVKEITGLDYPAKAGETAYAYLMRLSADKTGLYYEHRADCNAAAVTLRKSLQNAKDTLQAMPEVEQPPSNDELMKELERLVASQAERAKMIADSDRLGFRADAFSKAMEKEQENVTGIMIAIANLNHKLEAARQSHKAVAKESDEQSTLFAAAYDACCRLEDQTPHIEKVKQQIASAEHARAIFNRREIEKARVVHLKRECREAEEEAEEADSRLDTLRELRSKCASRIDIGVPGLEADEKGILISGVRLEAECMSRRLRLAVGVAQAFNPGVNVVRLDEGERLDHRSRMALIDICDERKAQLVLTAVKDSDQLTVTIRDA